MAKRRPLVAGNWKMHGTRASAAELVSAVLTGSASTTEVEIALCPPFVLIPLVVEMLARSGGRISCGAQNLDAHEGGAFTGEISGAMLHDAGCTYVIVGHSERRTLYGENDDVVAEKFTQAQRAGLTPIVCVGETLAEREANCTESVVERQLAAITGRRGVDALARATIAYEPVWAIGTGRTATPQQAQDVHRFLRGWIAAHDPSIAGAVRILYGGSVKAANAGELFAQPDIDGGLIGGASLQAQEFLAICGAAA